MAENRITNRRLLLRRPLSAIAVLLSANPTIAFSLSLIRSKTLQSNPIAFVVRTSESSFLSSPTALFAKKKDIKAAALTALESIDLKDDEPLSKKELLEQAKGKKKAVTDTVQDAASPKKKDGKLASLDGLDLDDDAPLSKKEQMELAKAAAKKKADHKEQDVPTKAKKDAKAASLAVLDLLDDEDLSPKKLNKKELRAQAAGIVGAQANGAKENIELHSNSRVNGRDADALSNVVVDDPKPSKNHGTHLPTINEKTATTDDKPPVDASEDQSLDGKPAMSRKEANMLRALQMEEEDAAAEALLPDDDEPKLSKKELKAQQKKEEKLAEKMAAKILKKQAKKEELENSEEDEEDDETTVAQDDDSFDDTEDEESESSYGEEDEEEHEQLEDGVTLEDKIRKERPPPRIRVMESTQPGYTSLRLENAGITFRNQVVLRDVTWGVQTGDRIGLVGANGAGKTTQLRILAGELEPTTGDVVKSSKDLRVAILRQEFVDELDPSRTLREEFFTVFDEENQILQDLRECEVQLENLGSSTDTDLMQEILDRMQELQAKADNKEVYALESRVQKVMNLMGFTEEEGDDLVASFSGGWKMRIGLGKVLLKDPNVLLLGKFLRSVKTDLVA